MALVGEWVDADLARTARLLCPQVRALLLEVEHGAQQLARELYWEFGAAVRVGGLADVRVRFNGSPQTGELVLCDRDQLPEWSMELPGVCLPEQLETIALLNALWQAGRIDVKDLYLRHKKRF